MTSQQRVTMIAVPPGETSFDWNQSPQQLTFVQNLPMLKSALEEMDGEGGLDIERIVIDRAATADDFLDFLSMIPVGFAGDVVYLRDNLSGTLSAAGRGGDRRLYSLGPLDVRFYLEAHDLVRDRMALKQVA